MRLVEPPEPQQRVVERLPRWQHTLLWVVLIMLTLPWWIGVWVLVTWAV